MAKKRKTREEKIRAQERRLKQQTSEIATPTFTFVKRELEAGQARPEPSTLEREKPEKTGQYQIVASTSLDLRKTFLIASIIFFLEAVLYWLWK